MGYVGRGLNQDGGQYRKLDSIATSFNGSETNFTLTIDGLEVTPTAQNLMISLGGVVQEPGTAFTVNGSTITFASAPADATTFFGVLMGEATFIARGTVGAAEMGITAGAVSASAGVVVDSSKNIIGFNEVSASIFKGSFSGDTSSSINTRINSLVTNSGSFSTRTTTLESASGSLSTRVTTNETNLTTLKGGGTLQSVATNASPTFVGATITGTLTAQEIHTEFESASIIFSSGSTIFGDTSNDIHRMTGSLNVSGAINLNNGKLTLSDSLDMQDNNKILLGTGDDFEIFFDGTNSIFDHTPGGGQMFIRSDQLAIDDSQSTPKNYATFYQGTGVVFNEDSEDHDFRVESNGNTHMLFVDGGNNGVGINTSSPSYFLHVRAADGDSDNNAVARFENLEATAGRSKGVMITAGSSADDWPLHIESAGGSDLARVTGRGDLSLGGTVVNRGGMNRVLEVQAGSDGEVSITATDELSDDQRIGQFAFYTDKSQYNMACIIGRVSGTDENRGELTFHTRYTESGGTPTERWRMKSTGTFEPGTNNAVNLGATDKRVSVIYTSNSVNVSDRTLKENITASDLGLTFIDTLQPKSFNMKDLTEAHDDYGRRHHGLIAQDLLNTPLSGSVFGDKDGEYSLAYNDLIGPMIKAIQELSTEVQSLKAQVSGSN